MVYQFDGGRPSRWATDAAAPRLTLRRVSASGPADASLRDAPQDEVVVRCPDSNDSVLVGKTLIGLPQPPAQLCPAAPGDPFRPEQDTLAALPVDRGGPRRRGVDQDDG